MILSSFFTIVHIGVLGILLNDYLKRTFPEQYDNILINMAVNSIYIFSKVQLFSHLAYTQVKLKIYNNKFLKHISDEVYNKNINNEICHVKNNSTHIKYFTDVSNVHFEEESNSFYIFSDNINTSNNCVNKVLLYSQPFNITYEVSNIKFVLLEVKLNDNTYKIDLKSDVSNYYIVNNIFDKNFFIYYLKNYQLCTLTNEEVEKIDKLDIKLIDQDVNIKELEITDKKFIVIKKDEYIY